MTASRLLLLHAETPLHPGSGSALGAVDLPVARERHTQWPLIPGSSLKGVLRDVCRRKHHAGKDERGPLWVAFGPDTANASESAGALSFTDARILAFPVRSLSGLFAWATCPAALERFVRDARIGKVKNAVAEAAKKLCSDAMRIRNANNDTQAMVAPGSPLCVGTNLVLEEFDYAITECPSVAELGKVLDAELGGDGMRLESHLAVISDNTFTFSTRYSTEVSARVKLNPESKTVEKGALFYQEFLPAGTIFSSLTLADESLASSGIDVMKYITDALGAEANVIQLGGNATIGKGICTAKLVGQGA